MYTNENFAEDVARNFAFLETDYGMRREPAPAASGGAWVVYSNLNVKVIVEHEIGGHCGVTVVNLRHIKHDPLERSEFDLDEILTIAGRRPPQKQQPRSMTEAVTKAAEALRSSGANVLNGDFEALHARQLKLAEALRRHNPLTDN